MDRRLPRYSKEESARRGEEIFERKIRDKVRDEDPRTLVAIDIETEEYELGQDVLQVTDQLRRRVPDAQIWLRRVGTKYVHRFGIRSVSPRVS